VTRRGLLLVLGLALAVRLVALGVAWGMEPRIGDEQHYQAIATNLVHGEGFSQWGAPTSMRPPLYPFLIAAIWTATGVGQLDAVRLVQVALGVLTVAAVYALGRRMYGERVGLIAAAIAAVYPSLIVTGVLLLTETIFTLLVVLLVLAFARLVKAPTAWAATLVGLCLGFGALARSVLWPFVVIVVALILVTLDLPWRRRAALALAAVLGYAVVVGPWAVRNTRLQHTTTIVDSMGGLNLMMGNYEHTPEDRMWAAVELTGDRNWVSTLPLHDDDGSDWTEGKKEKWAQRQALAYMKAHPGTTARRSAIKFADFWGLEREFIAGMDRGLFPVSHGPAIAMSLAITLAWTAVALLSAVGVTLNPPSDWRTHVFVVLLVGFVCFVHTVVFAHSRYHLPLVPLLGIYAAAALTGVGWRDLLLFRRGLPAVAACGLVVLLLGIWTREVLVRDREHIAAFVRLVS